MNHTTLSPHRDTSLYMNHTHTPPSPLIEILDPSCLRDLLQQTNKANTKWYDIGLQLGVLAHVLDGLRIQYQNNPSDCYREALKEWLNGGEGSWRGLSQALSSNTVREHKLAKEIDRKLLPTQAEQGTNTHTQTHDTPPPHTHMLPPHPHRHTTPHPPTHTHTTLPHTHRHRHSKL